jgi:hypothetical protein
LIDEFEEAVAQPQPQSRSRRGEYEQPRGEGSSQGVRVQSGGQAAGHASTQPSGAGRTAPRPLPWDTPLQPASAPRRADAAGIGAEDRHVDDEDDVVRITRGPGAPIDER